MTDNTLTVNEIMTILADCFPNDHRFVTIYNGHTGEATCVTLQDILDAFNRQKSEIARLRSGYKNESQSLNAYLNKLVKKQKETIDKQEAEIERLKDLKRFENFIDERIHTDKVRGLKWDFKTKEDRDKAFEKELETLFDIASAKAEAVKEVFEKIDERLAVHSFTSNSTEYSDGMLDCLEWVDSKIDELKKEMVGE